MSVRDGLPCTLDGRGFLLDVEQFEFASMDPTRQGTDTGAGASEASLSNQVVWRRVRDNWVGGAGQEYADLPDDEDPSSAIRFHTATPGIDCFDRRKLTLHPEPTARIWLPPKGVDGSMVRVGTCAAASAMNVGSGTETMWFAVVHGVYDWNAATTGVGLILASNSDDTEAGFRFRIFNDGVDTKLHLDLNTVASATTYDKTFASSALTLTGSAEHRMFGVVWGIASGQLRVRFFNYTGSLHDGFRDPYDNIQTGWTMFSSSSDAGVIIAPGTGGSEVTFGNGWTPGAVATKAGGNELGSAGLLFGVAAGRRTASITAFPYASTSNPSFSCNFVDGNAWHVGGSTFTFANQVHAPRNDGGTGATVTLSSADVAGQTSTTFQMLRASGGTAAIPDGWGWLLWITPAILVESFVHSGPPDFDEFGRLAHDDQIRWIIPDWLTSRAVTTRFASASQWKAGVLLTTSDATTGLYEFDGSTLSSLLAGDFDMVAACGSRVLCSTTNTLYELTATPSTTTIYAHYNDLFRWYGAVAGPGAIYAWGDDGGTTQFFRLPINDATGAISPPVPVGATELTETVRAAVLHEGVFILGTMRGLRLALINADGSLIMGGLLEVGRVDWDQLVASGRFAWAVTATGVVKLDLSRFTDPDALLPAWSYIPASPHAPPGEAWSWLTGDVDLIGLAPVSEFDDPQPLYLFGSNGYWLCDWVEFEGGDCTATLDLGWFTWGIGETLALDSVTVEADPTPGGSVHSIAVHVDTPLADSVLTGSYDPSGEGLLTVRNTGTDMRAQRFKVRLVLTGDTTAGTAPVVRRITLRAVPAPEIASEEMLLPLVLTDTVTSEVDEDVELDVFAEFQHLLSLRESRQPVTLTIGDWSKTVRVEGLAIRGGGLGGGNGLDGFDERERWLAGTWNVRVVTLD